MVDKRRGFIGVVLVLAVIAFVGFSMGPLISGIVENNQSKRQPAPTPTQSAQAGKQSDLQAQARGYELVLQREPDNETALKGLLQAKLELIRFKQAEIKDVIEPLEKLSKKHPEDTRYSVLLAQAKAYTGDQEGAAQTYRTILASQPGDIQALQGLVNLFLEQKRPEAAIGLLQDTLKSAATVNQTAPGTIDEMSVQLILGQVYAEDKRYDEALAIYDEAIKNNDQDFRPVYAKALVLKEQGNTEEAEPLFAKAVDLAPAVYKDQIQKQAGGNLAPAKSGEPPEPKPLETQPQTESAPATEVPEPRPSAPASSN
ncbi:tetratricopeptide repeat protein [Planktothrix mougeotii]|uniref:Tetratricopeptide repeat protein n=1 Tax=Planktothrix mougeotii LEGE 06226 TaxID=1828728 RepID=A0ABR9UMY5_9CYAN|nr:tetratricopeptide repeat protein [Planktothrix mougeotii]MBE9146909.1 tetratricopeptide repeat protein [Planktothrix mougeotii LEGE 06226]